MKQAKCSKERGMFKIFHKEEALVADKESKEIKFLTGFIFYHSRKQQFMVLLTSGNKVRHEILIQLGNEFSKKGFINTTEKFEAMKAYGSSILDHLQYHNGVLYYKKNGSLIPEYKERKLRGRKRSGKSAS